MDASFLTSFGQIILLGDSITQQAFSGANIGWAARLADRFSRRADVLNRGLSGYNTRWTLEHWDTIVASVPRVTAAGPADTIPVAEAPGLLSTARTRAESAAEAAQRVDTGVTKLSVTKPTAPLCVADRGGVLTTSMAAPVLAGGLPTHEADCPLSPQVAATVIADTPDRGANSATYSVNSPHPARSSVPGRVLENTPEDIKLMLVKELRLKQQPVLFTTVLFGANDCARNYQHVPMEEFERNIVQIVRNAVRDFRCPRVVLMTPPPCDGRKWARHKLVPVTQIPPEPAANADEDQLTAAQRAEDEKLERSYLRHSQYADAVRRVGVKLLSQGVEIALVDVFRAVSNVRGGFSDAMADGLHLGATANEAVFEALTAAVEARWPVFRVPVSPVDAPTPMFLPHHSTYAEGAQ